MRRFRFNLEKVLEHKKYLEEEKKNQLAEVQGRINRETGRIDELKQQRRELFQGEVGKSYDSRQTALRVMKLAGMDRFISGARDRIDNMQGELEEARREYTEAYKQRMIFEKLKEKRRKEFDLEERRREERELSESARVLYRRQQQEEKSNA